MPTWRGGTYRFVVTSANASANATYTNNGQTFTVTDTISAGTVLFCTGTGAPAASGTLTRTSGTGDATITFSSVTAPNNNWGTSTNWLTDGSGAGVPTTGTGTAGTGTDATFDNKSGNCTVNVAATCKNLTFNSGTGYTNTITMTNNISVGATSTSNPNPTITLSSGMFIQGAGSLLTRGNGTTSLRSNGRTWPNNLGINSVNNVSTSLVALLDDWDVGSLTIGTGTFSAITFSGAFTITVRGNFNVSTTNTSGRIQGTDGSVSTIKLAGTGTWSHTVVMSGFGINLTIDTTGTITIADGCCFGGQGNASGATLKYTAGTVITQGTFHLINRGSAFNPYTIDVNGDSSTSATTTSTTGINFNNLSLNTTVVNAQIATVVGRICVVNNFTVFTSSTTAKNLFTFSGGDFYLNSNITLTSTYLAFSGSSPTYRIQGSGTRTWNEDNVFLSPGITSNFGISGNVIINISSGGTLVLGNYVGFKTGTLTFTNGTINYNGFGFRLQSATLAGFSTTGTIPYIMHTTNQSGLAASIGARLTINDSSPINIGTLVFEGFNVSNGFTYFGTAGWTVSNFIFEETAATTGFSTVRLLSGNTYRVTTNFRFLGRFITQQSLSNGFAGEGGIATFILNPGASQYVYIMSANNIDSSAGQTVWTRKGLLSAATNWKNINDPVSIHKTYISN